MFATQHVVVYKSEGEALFDQWYWHGGGAAVIGWLALAFIVVVVIGAALSHGKRR